MPRSNRVVDNESWSLVNDLTSYYRGSVVTYVDADGVRWAACISAIHGEGHDPAGMSCTLNRLAPQGELEWLANETVPWTSLDLTLPKLGMVEFRGQWLLLQRNPARRMRKGYHHETITPVPLEGEYIPDEFNVLNADALRQIWYGAAADRITTNIVKVQKRLYYTTELVAEFDDQGRAVLIPGKEKMGELACKQLLANNYEFQVVRPTVPTQAS